MMSWYILASKAYQWMSKHVSAAKIHFIKFNVRYLTEKVTWKYQQHSIREEGIEDSCDLSRGPLRKIHNL